MWLSGCRRPVCNIREENECLEVTSETFFVSTPVSQRGPIMSINIRPTLALREKSQASHSFEGGQSGSTAGVPRQESDRKTLSHPGKTELGLTFATAKCHLTRLCIGLI